MCSTARQGATPHALTRTRSRCTNFHCTTRLLGSILAVGITFTACGRRPDSARPVTLTVVGLGLDAGGQLRQDALDEFTRNTGIQVDLIPTWGTSTEQLGLALKLLSQHVSTPDIYVIDSIWPGTLANDLLDLTPYIGEEARVHWPDLLNNDRVRGRMVSLPFYLNVGILYCRGDLLKKYSYPHPPRTWDELEAMAAHIQEGERAAGNPGFWGYVWQGGPYEGLTCDALEWQTSFGGGGIIERDGAITVNNPRSARAFRMAAGWIGKISPPSVLSYNEADSLNAFRSGKAAFLRYWVSGLAIGDTGTGIGARFTPTQLPSGPGGQAGTIGGFQLGVSRYSAHPRQAAQLVAFLTGRQVQLRRAVRGYLPTIPDLYGTPQLVRALPQVETLRNGTFVVRPSTVSGGKYAAVSKAYYQTVHDMLSGRVEVESGLAGLEKQLAAITGLSVAAARPDQ